MNKLLLVLVLLVLSAGVADAAWQDNFEDGATGPLSWQKLVLAPGTTGTLNEAFPTPGTVGEGDYMLQLYGDLSAGVGGAQVVVGYIIDTMSNATISGLVAADPDHGQDADVGLVGRMSIAGGVPSGYVLTIDFVTGTLDITRFDNGADTGIGTSGTIAGIVATEDYYLEFELNGSSISGRAYDEIGGTLLATATATDGGYASGDFGVGASANTAGQSYFAAGLFDNVVVPEPATMSLLTLGAVSMLLRRRRRR